jgi:hypothetical protein
LRRIVHKHVDRALLPDDPESRSNRRRTCHVEGHGMGSATPTQDVLDHGVCQLAHLLRRVVGDERCGTLGRESAGDGSPDPRDAPVTTVTRPASRPW